jgi:hypothetical protein
LLDLRATELTQEVELKATLGRIADKVSTNEPPDSSDWALLESNAYELSFEHGEFWTHGLARNADILECPQDQADWYDLEDQLPEERIEALNDGAEPTASEVDLLRGMLIEKLFEAPDDDFMPGLWTMNLEGRNGTAVAVVACYGYSFTGVSRRLVGVYQSPDEARIALGKDYYLGSVQDADT